MKLLFDENLSPGLAPALASEYPGSAHVKSLGLLGATDRQIWSYARDNDFVIVSKDTDFRERSLADGAPPKVIWLAVGNAGTRAIVFLLLQERLQVQSFGADLSASVLILPIGPRAV